MKFMQKAAVLKVTQKREIIKYLAKNYSTIVNSNITLVENYSRIQRLTGALPKSSRAMNESACAFFSTFCCQMYPVAMSQCCRQSRNT